MAKLRGHHLICLHFYDGEGYDDLFISNLEEVLARIEEGGVVVAEGPDDVCEPCPHRREESCTFSPSADREVRKMDERALELLDLGAGKKVGWKYLGGIVADIMPQWYATYCFACTWKSACERNDLFRLLTARKK